MTIVAIIVATIFMCAFNWVLAFKIIDHTTELARKRWLDK